MKICLTVLIALVWAGAASAQTYQKPIGPQPKVRSIERHPPVVQRENVQGAIPRGIRGGNPLQMLNPNAPAKYGTSMQSVVIDRDTWKWKGIKLFEIFF